MSPQLFTPYRSGVKSEYEQGIKGVRSALRSYQLAINGATPCVPSTPQIACAAASGFA
jgi:hypothetical protein